MLLIPLPAVKSGAMKVFDIIIDVSKSGFEDSELEHHLWDLLSFLYDTRQIVNDEYQFVRSGDSVRVSVACPEPSALMMTPPTRFIADKWAAIEALTQAKIEITQIGTDPNQAGYVIPQNPSFYILRQGWFSPLLCGDTGKPIPLYRIPPTNPDGDCYDNLRFWEKAYHRLYGLWIGSGVGERFALGQMQDHQSALSQQGRALCERIEALTGTPTYYHLFNYRGWSEKQDQARLCPVTGKLWRIEGSSTADFIAFKSDEARLVSELSFNCR